MMQLETFFTVPEQTRLLIFAVLLLSLIHI